MMPTIELVPLEHLDPAPYNSRKISDQQLDALARSMREFGVVDPVIANRGRRISGEVGTLSALCFLRCTLVS